MSRLGRRNVALAMCALTAVAVLAVAVDLHGPVRSLVLLLAVMLVPGAAVVSKLGLDDLASSIGLTVVTSMAVATGIGMAMMWFQVWHPLAMGLVVAIVSNVVLVWEAVRVGQPPLPTTTNPEPQP